MHYLMLLDLIEPGAVQESPSLLDIKLIFKSMLGVDESTYDSGSSRR